MKNDNPLSPHIQIYNWHISSLVSISHRITGIINIIIITLICFWVSLLLLGLIVIFGSFILTIFIFILGRNLVL